jgi:endonuclease-3
MASLQLSFDNDDDATPILTTAESDTSGGTSTLAEKALLIHERLCTEYHCPIAYFHNLDPLSELVSSLLSHRTKNADSGRAFKNLRARFATWEEVRDAEVGEVQETIAPVTWPEQKAPRIQDVLREITIRRGKLELDFLTEMSVRAARDWLEELPGVGPKTSAAVLAFSTLRLAALAVDSHHHRVAQRLGLIPAKLSVGPAHAVLEAQLPADWDAQQIYDNHEVMMLHGQRCCLHYNPDCDRCPVLDLCPFGQKRLAAERR